MKYTVILDFEFNVIQEREVRKKYDLSREIVEFGAVMLNQNNEMIKEFRRFTRPQLGQLTHMCTCFTGITMKQVAKAQTIEECLNSFLNWLGKVEDVCIYAWSDSDLRQLKEECLAKHIQDTRLDIIFNNWHDLQAEFSGILGETRKYGLQTALQKVGLIFAGSQHDALDDARNTAELFVLVQKPNEIRQQFHRESFREEEPFFTLGDIFKCRQLALCV